jgi:Glycine cleavage H-protein
MHSLRYASNLTSALRVQRAYPRRALPSSLLALRRTIVSEYSTQELQASLVSYLRFPAKRYTQDHEVIKYDNESGVGTVNITDYAQKSLGDVVFVELPERGATILQGGQ